MGDEVVDFSQSSVPIGGGATFAGGLLLGAGAIQGTIGIVDAVVR